MAAQKTSSTKKTKTSVVKTPVKKVVAKKTAKTLQKKTVAARVQPMTNTTVSSHTDTVPVVSRGNRSVGAIVKTPQFIIGLILVLLVLGYLFKSLFVVAMVNGQPITRSQFNHQLELQSGKQVLSSLVTQSIILQAAQRQGITISQKDIDAQVKQISDTLSRQGTTLDQALATRGMTKADFTDQLRIQQIAQKMFAKDIMVSDQEVADYIAKNPDTVPQGQDPQTINASVRQQLSQQKLSTKFQAWLASEQKKAKVSYFVSY